MLESLAITCPLCRRPTEIAVSRASTTGGDPAGLASTRCRQCRAPFITMTQADGRVLVLDGATSPDPARGPTVLKVIEPPAGPSGYRVTPPDRLDLFTRGRPRLPQPGLPDSALISGDVVPLDGLLHRPDGSARPPAEAARVVGWRSVWVAQLDEAIEDRLAAPPPLSFPPTIFISYRWGSDEDNAWVAALARTLKQRGYPVTFDRDEAVPGIEVDVPALVSRVADCRYFLAVLDPGYAARIDEDEAGRTQDGWVFDEFNTAVRLSKAGQLRIVGFFRGGHSLPRGFGWPEPGKPGNTIDVSTPERLAAVLDDVFPPVPAPDEATTLRARALLHQSHAYLLAGRLQEAFDCAAELTALLPGVTDGPAQQIRVALAAGAAQYALDAAEAALTLAPESQELLLVAGTSAGDTGRHSDAARYLSRFLERSDARRPAEDAIAHQALGSALDELGYADTALAHLERARHLDSQSPGRLQTLAYVYRRAGRPADAATCYRQAIEASPDQGELYIMLAATELEAGELDAADALIGQLESALPGNATVRHLRTAFQDSSRGSLPVFIERAIPAGHRLVVCAGCQASIRVPDEGPVSLCAGCGIPLPRGNSPCPCCNATGRAYPELPMAVQCPVCRHGHVRVA